MTPQECVEAVVAWAQANLPELVGAYDYIPLASDEPLPDVVVDLSSMSMTVGGGGAFPSGSIQQAWVLRYDLELSFMVSNEDAQGAAAFLREVAHKLTATLLADGSLGDRVPFASPFFSFDFTAPFVERDDGTRGREMTMQMSVGELVEEPQ